MSCSGFLPKGKSKAHGPLPGLTRGTLQAVVSRRPALESSTGWQHSSPTLGGMQLRCGFTQTRIQLLSCRDWCAHAFAKCFCCTRMASFGSPLGFMFVTNRIDCSRLLGEGCMSFQLRNRLDAFGSIPCGPALKARETPARAAG